jgi:hypothetical protein
MADRGNLTARFVCARGGHLLGREHVSDSHRGTRSVTN